MENDREYLTVRRSIKRFRTNFRVFYRRMPVDFFHRYLRKLYYNKHISNGLLVNSMLAIKDDLRRRSRRDKYRMWYTFTHHNYDIQITFATDMRSRKKYFGVELDMFLHGLFLKLLKGEESLRDKILTVGKEMNEFLNFGQEFLIKKFLKVFPSTIFRKEISSLGHIFIRLIKTLRRKLYLVKTRDSSNFVLRIVREHLKSVEERKHQEAAIMEKKGLEIPVQLQSFVSQYVGILKFLNEMKIQNRRSSNILIHTIDYGRSPWMFCCGASNYDIFEKVRRVQTSSHAHFLLRKAMRQFIPRLSMRRRYWRKRKRSGLMARGRGCTSIAIKRFLFSKRFERRNRRWWLLLHSRRRRGRVRRPQTKRLGSSLLVLKNFYGFRTFRKWMQFTRKRRPSIMGQRAFFFILERRLECMIYRANLARSIQQARYYVKSGIFTVNGHVCRRGAYIVKPSDIVSVVPEYRLKMKSIVLFALVSGFFRQPPQFFVIDYRSMKFAVSFANFTAFLKRVDGLNLAVAKLTRF